MKQPINYRSYRLATIIFLYIATTHHIYADKDMIRYLPNDSTVYSEGQSDSIPLVKELQELTVTAKRNAVVVSADKISYSPAEIVSGQSNLYEAIQFIPGITIDTQGNISLNGIQNVAVQIDENNP